MSIDGRPLEFRLPVGSALDLFQSLQDGGCPIPDLAALSGEGDRKVTAATELQKLWGNGWIILLVKDGPSTIATLQNFGDMALFPPPPPSSTRLSLTEDALIRRTNSHLAIESVTRGAIVRCVDARLFALPGLLVTPATVDTLSPALGLPDDIVTSVLAWLVALGAVSASEMRVPCTGWSFSDRLMHARSRRGRHTGGYGGTFPLRGRIGEPPAIRPSRPDRTIPLHRPDLADIARREGSFTSVLEARRSVRQHSEAPLAFRELSEFLYRVARVTSVRADGPYGVALRPYPSGGGLHELELYPLVNRCDRLAPALYRYHGGSHALERITEPTPETHRLLTEAAATCLMQTEPHVLMLIAARFLRINWKYESIAYALTLKHVGVLVQTMYLVATAMGLGPCCLGGGNADGFSRATQLDYWEESLVGEFMLGRPADSRAGRPTPV